MALTVVRPAPFLDTVALVRGLAGLKPHMSALATFQVAGSATWGFVDEGGRLLAVMGLWPLSDGEDEIYLVGRPAAEVGPRLLEMSRRARLILAHRLHSGTRRIVGFVRIGHEPGARLARLAGFRLSREAAPLGLTRWEIASDEWLGRRALRQFGEEGAGSGGT